MNLAEETLGQMPEEAKPALLCVPSSMNVEQYVDKLTAAAVRVPQQYSPVLHRFAPGLYIREVSAPAGTYAIGHRQKERHLNIMLKGRVTILNDNGTTTDLVAPMMFVGEPGRKCGYIHEDMVWQNIYATEETDVEKLEARFIDKSADWLELCKDRLALDSARRESDREDYRALIAQYGYTEEMVQAEIHSQDVIPFPEGTYKVMISDSPIQGKGMFATMNLVAGEPICLGRLNGKRTPAGRYTNHSANPNALPVMLETGDIGIVALRNIHGNHGGTIGEEITIDYRIALRMRSH